MSKLNQTPSINKPKRKVPAAGTADIPRRRRRTIFIIAAALIVLILIIAGIVGVSYYFSEDAKFNRLTIITVDDTSIEMDYFLKRIRLSGGEAMEMVQTLLNEQLVKIEAPRYVGEVTPENVDTALRIMASGEDGTISESEFKEWYRQLLNELDLPDSEYRDMVATGILTASFHGYLAERVPTVAEQVYLYSTFLSEAEANEIWGGKSAGEDVEELISGIWQDRESAEGVSDVGWTPRGVLPAGFDDIAFSLNVGDISDPVAYVDFSSPDYETYYYLLMVSEKAEAREIEEGPLQTIKSQVLDEWLVEEAKSGSHEITLNYNSEIDAWINYQLSKD